MSTSQVPGRRAFNTIETRFLAEGEEMDLAARAETESQPEQPHANQRDARAADETRGWPSLRVACACAVLIVACGALAGSLLRPGGTDRTAPPVETALAQGLGR